MAFVLNTASLRTAEQFRKKYTICFILFFFSLSKAKRKNKKDKGLVV
jgi:hypothetical protein